MSPQVAGCLWWFPSYPWCSCPWLPAPTQVTRTLAQRRGIITSFDSTALALPTRSTTYYLLHISASAQIMQLVRQLYHSHIYDRPLNELHERGEVGCSRETQSRVSSRIT